MFLPLLLFFANAANAALFNSPDELPKNKYDFVIAGAGTAGSVLAARLTENPSISVLVIEAGISDEGILGVECPFLPASNLPNSSVTWNYTTTPQSGLGGRVLDYSRGRVLGGSSSINFLTYTRGSDAEYDRIAQLTQSDTWKWSNLKSFYMKSSKLVPPADNHDTSGECVPTDHGNGPVDISLPGFPNELDDRVIQTAKTSLQFPYNIDLQSGNSVGISLAQNTVGGGVRSSASTAYLRPALNRPNLDVVIGTTVTKLISSGVQGGKAVVRKVEIASNGSATRKAVSANKEVILSTGSIGTPQILLLSGIGDKKALSKLGIQSLVNLPDVGQNLQDHPIMSNYFQVNSNNTFDDVLRDPTILGADLDLWLASKTGLFTNAPGSQLGFLRVPPNSPIFSKFKDPSAGKTSGHFEMIFADGYGATVVPQPAEGHFITVNTAVVSPLSRGSVKLASSNPFASPLIDPGFFTSDFDSSVMVEAVKAARSFVQTAPWKGFIKGRFGVVGDANTDQEIVAAARQSVVTIWHPVSTARMSPDNATWGVVDSQLRVKGTVGLRIVDASVFPVIPAAHTVGPVYIIAEKAADIIKGAWGLPCGP